MQPKIAKTRPGADCGSDHELLIAKFRLKLKKVKGGEKGRVVDRDGIGYTLTATEYKDPLKIAEPVIVGSMQAHAAVKTDGICPTLTEAMGMGGGQVPVHTYGVRIRKLTPRECWRLMGFLDEEFDRVHGISNSQLYKQAGNSIVVNVLSALLSQLFYKVYICEATFDLLVCRTVIHRNIHTRCPLTLGE